MHKEEKPFSCEVCNKRFLQESFLNRHLFAQTDEKPLVYEVCICSDLF